MSNSVYGRRPRKPYEISRKPRYIPLQQYSRTFKLQRTIKENKKLSGILIIAIVITLGWFFIIQGNHFTKYSKAHNKSIQAIEKVYNANAFQFLMESGIERLNNNNVLGAYSEFKLAYKLQPNNPQLKRLIIETTSVLCTKNEDYCNALDFYLSAD